MEDDDWETERENIGNDSFADNHTLETLWIPCFTEGGLLYYYNTETSESQWECPSSKSFDSERASAPESDNDPLRSCTRDGDESDSPLQKLLQQIGQRIDAFEYVTNGEFEALDFSVSQLQRHRNELVQGKARALKEVERLQFIVKASNRRCDLLETLAQLAQEKLYDERVANARYCSGLERQLKASIDANKQLFHELETAEKPNSKMVPSQRIDEVWNKFFHNVKDTPLSLSDVIQRGDIVTLQQLLVEKGDLSSDEPCALHLACRYGQPEIMALLVEYAADIEERDEQGNTPLLLACQYGQSECVRFLVRSAANLYARNHAGESAIELAIQSRVDDCVTILKDYGVDLSLGEERSDISSSDVQSMDRLSWAKWLFGRIKQG